MIHNILTIDIEDWYQSSLEILGQPDHGPVAPTDHVVTNTRRLLRILAEHEAHATCFILGTVADAYPGLVQEIHAAGHDIATHGYSHRLVYRMTPAEFKCDVARSIQSLESALQCAAVSGEPPSGSANCNGIVRGYRAPYFSITPKSGWALDTLAESGIQYDSSVFPIRRGLYGFPPRQTFPYIIHTAAGNLREFPAFTVRLARENLPVGGGGYFRLLAYFLTAWSIRRVNRQGHPVIFYLHPYELDTDELRNALPGETGKIRLTRWSQRLNRERTEGKLKRLLSDFQWTSAERWMAEQA